MPLSPGTRLGPYEIVAAVGAGGMGEVYRARDTRLGRDVAVKVLPPAFVADADRLRRFEQEARAASQLNHPNILTIFDVGSSGGVAYLVSELLEGETLRARLESAPLPVRKALDCAAQVAQAIAAAHDMGIVHRDLKPDNLFLTRDGRVKVLDFGLAKLREVQAAAAGAETPTVATDTGAGVVLGTVGYMSPEQVRGRHADERSDIFALGTILYEMLAGRRAFQRDSAAETMSAIVREDPPPLEQSGIAVPPAVSRIIDHCLEKNPDERFQSARDLAFDLRTVTDASGSRGFEVGAAVDGSPVLRARLRRAALAVAALVAIAALGFVAGRRTASVPPLWFDKITFHQGQITAARFAPDGKTIVYTAAWGGEPEHAFVTQPGNSESRPLDLPPHARVVAIARSGEMALMLNVQPEGGFVEVGTLARVPASGGAPREMLENVEAGDWGPDGESMAIVRTVGGRSRVEFPIGTVLFETGGWINCLRVASDGDAVAFLHHPVRGNDAGDVVMVDRQKHVKVLATGLLSSYGLAWGGDEVLFTASMKGNTKALYAVSRSGRRRLVVSGTGSLVVYDEAADGRVLVARSSDRIGLAVRAPADAQERDMSWLDWTLLRDIDVEGKVIAFDESGEGAGAQPGVYVRRTDGSPAVRLGDGLWPMLSPDGRWVACLQGASPVVVLLPTGAGESRRLETPRVRPLSAAWFPDGRRLLVGGTEAGHALRYYVVPLDGGDPRPVTPEGSHPFSRAISPDGRYVLTMAQDGGYKLFPVEGGAAESAKGLGPSDLLARMPTADTVYVYDRLALPMPLSLVNLKTGRRTVLATIGSGRPLEGGRPFSVRVSADGRAYAYSYYQTTSELFLMTRGER